MRSIALVATHKFIKQTNKILSEVRVMEKTDMKINHYDQYVSVTISVFVQHLRGSNELYICVTGRRDLTSFTE